MTPSRATHKTKNSEIEWVGTIPEHWSALPFYSFVDEVSNPNKGLKERNLLSLSYGRIVRKDLHRLVGLTPASFEGYNIINANDIVFRLTDLQNDQTSLRSARATERGIITSAYVTVRPRSSPRFFDYLMRSYDTTKVFYGIGGGIRQSMKFADLKRLPVVVPPDDEMEAISTYLDRAVTRIEALIAKKTHFIELLLEKRQALVTHTVTKGLDAKVPMTDSGIEWLGKVPAHWTVPKLRHIAVVQTGIAKGKDVRGTESISVPYLRVANVQDGYLDLSEVSEIEIPRADLSRYLLRPGDVLMNEGGDNDKLGRGHIWRGEIECCIHQNHVFAVRPFGVTSEWLNTYSGSIPAQQFFTFRAKQTTNLASISSNSLMDLPVPRPPLPEQQAIVAYLDRANARIDTLVTKTKRSIELLREHRTALITAAVTGKINLRESA
jgi:type I restriction enzyme, S subunit